jgi:thiamine monophosphate kinase
MKIKIIARSDRDVFVGTEPDGSFCVLSLTHNGEIEIKDVLEGNFDASDGVFKSVRNITRNQEVHICAENWSCSKKVAFEALHRINRPTKIFAL